MAAKGYRGIGMEGGIATWYARNTAGDERFAATAERVAARAPAGGAVLEIAPGPGYLAIELARRGFCVAAVDISRSFVRMAQANARAAGVSVDVRWGNASDLPFAQESFDAVVCMAAFKNFSDPLGAINEMYRVLRNGREAVILDMSREASNAAIAAEVHREGLSGAQAWWQRVIFRLLLRRRAYSRNAIVELAAASRFGRGEMELEGIGFSMRLRKPSEPGTASI